MSKIDNNHSYTTRMSSKMYQNGMSGKINNIYVKDIYYKNEW